MKLGKKVKHLSCQRWYHCFYKDSYRGIMHFSAACDYNGGREAREPYYFYEAKAPVAPEKPINDHWEIEKLDD